MIHDDVQTIFRTIFRNPNLVITDDMDADDVEAWDSLSHINMIVEVERHFGISFRNSEIARLQCVGDLKALIQKKKPELA